MKAKELLQELQKLTDAQLEREVCMISPDGYILGGPYFTGLGVACGENYEQVENIDEYEGYDDGEYEGDDEKFEIFYIAC